MIVLTEQVAGDVSDVDSELQRIQGVLRRNRRASLVAALAGFVVANAVFFSLHFAWPELGLGVDAAVALLAATLVALGVWLSLRARSAAFAKGAPVAEDMPDPSLELRIEASAIEVEAPPTDLRALRRELAEGVPEVRAEQRRERLRLALVIGCGLVVPAAVLFLFDLGYTKLGDPDLGIGSYELLLAALAGLGSAFLASRLVGRGSLDPVPSLARDGDRDWFRDTLSTTGSVVLRAPSDFGAVLARALGFSVRRWTLLDGSEALFADAAEPRIAIWRRLLPFRARTIAVSDVDGVRIELTRPARPFARWSARYADTNAGAIERGLFGAVVRDAAGAEAYRVRRSWIFGRRYGVFSAGTRVCEMRRSRTPWFSRRPSDFTVEFPRAAPVERRALLLAAAITIDVRRL